MKLQTEVKKLKRELKMVKTTVAEHGQRINTNEQKQRENNFIVSGIKQGNPDTIEHLLKELRTILIVSNIHC